MPTPDTDHRIGHVLVIAVVAASVVRLVAAVVSGTLAASSGPNYEPGRVHLADTLQGFGSAGDSLGVLFLLGAVAMLWWLCRDQDRPPAGLLTCVSVLLALTALSAVVRITGLALLVSPLQGAAASWPAVDALGVGVAELPVLAGGLFAVARLRRGIESTLVDRPSGDGMMFAVDRGSSEVFAFFSPAEVTRTLSVYSIEDDEFLFYDHDGRIVEAAIVNGRVQFNPTDREARPDLLAHLQRFADHNDIGIGADDFNDPIAYAGPISDWQWLQLWPGWLRGIGRLVRRFR